jgi:hypothetical protein
MVVVVVVVAMVVIAVRITESLMSFQHAMTGLQILSP